MGSTVAVGILDEDVQRRAVQATRHRPSPGLPVPPPRAPGSSADSLFILSHVLVGTSGSRLPRSQGACIIHSVRVLVCREPRRTIGQKYKWGGAQIYEAEGSHVLEMK